MEIRVVLVEPLYEFNIGYVARSMKNFALNELYIVRPQTRIGPIARMMAMHGQDILSSAVIVDSLEDAIKGVDYVIGTTGKSGRRDIARSLISLNELCKLIKQSKVKGKLALLLGREDYGLTNDILERCDVVVTIPANPQYPILNLSHAAVIFFYEFYKLRRKPKLAIDNAPGEMKERLIDYFNQFLELISYPSHKKRAAIITFRRLLGRSFASRKEVTILYGVFRRAIQAIKCSKDYEENI